MVRVGKLFSSSQFPVTGSRAGAHSAGADGTTKSRLFSIFIVTLMLVSVCVVFIPSTVQATPTYKLDDNFDDGDYTANPAWNVNGGTPTCTNSISHTPSYSVRFNGTSYQSLYFQTTNTLFPNQASFWFFVHYSTPGVIQDFFSTSDANWAIIGADIRLLNNAGTYELLSEPGDVLITTIPLDSWHNVYINCTVADSFKFFLDSIQKGTTFTGNAGQLGVTQIVTIGKNAGTSSVDYYMDDVQLLRYGTDPTPPPSYWAPTITSTPAANSRANITYSYQVTVNETSTVTASNLPSWASMCHNGTAGPWFVNGTTPWTSTVQNLKLKAQSTAGTLYAYQNWSVTIGRWAPAITSTAQTGSRANITYSYQVTLNETGTVTALNLPSWASMCHNGTAGPWFVNGTTPWTSNGYNFKLKAPSTNGTLNTYQNFTVTVGRWVPTFASSPNTTVIKESLYSYTPHLNETGTIQSVTLPNWGAFANGIVNGTPTQNGAFNFSLRAVSANGTRWAWQNWSVTVGGWAPVFVNSPALSIIRGTEYDYTPLLNETGIIIAITLPSWAQLVDGTVTGTPTMLGVDNFGLKGTSTNGTLSAYKSWEVTVGGWAPTFTSTPPTTLRNNSAVSYYEPVTNESAYIYLVDFPIWAAQLINGTVIFVPNEAGIFNFSLEATSTAGSLSVYQNWTVTIGAWAPAFISSPDLTCQVNQLYDYIPELNETGTVYLESAPEIFAFEYSELLGYPDAAGEINISLRASSEDGGLYIWQNWTIIVSEAPPSQWAPAFISSPNLNGTVGESYIYDPELNESGTIYLDDGPVWLILDEGELGGIPLTSGPVNVSLRGDSTQGGLSSWQNWTITVAEAPPIPPEAPTITTGPITSGTETQFYEYDAAADETNITWSITGSAWFLYVNSATGEVTGIPDTAGIYSVHLMAENENGTAYQNWSVTIAHYYGNNGGDGGDGNGGNTNTNFLFNLSLDSWIVIGAAVLVLIAAIVIAGRRR